MRYLSEDESTQMMGLGYVGELYEDLDGHLYGWVEGLDEWGEPVGFWQGLSDSEVPASSSMGALYESPDGTVYQVQGLEEEEEGAEAAPEGEAAAAAEPAEAEPSAESEAPPATGPARPGRPRGFRRLRPIPRGRRRPPHLRARGARAGRPGPGARGGPPRKRRGGFFKTLLPIAKLASRFIPIPGAGAVVRGGLTLASKLGKRKGVSGLGGIGALYAAPDGTVYQVQGLAAEDLDGLYADEELRGFAEDEELRGLSQDEDLRGLDQDEELRGFAEDEELRGFAQDEELRGFAEDEELRGLSQDEDLRGLDQGYVREDAVSGLDAYLPTKPAKTRWFVAPDEPPEVWKPLW
jgi:hypothetical protein